MFRVIGLLVAIWVYGGAWAEAPQPADPMPTNPIPDPQDPVTPGPVYDKSRTNYLTFAQLARDAEERRDDAKAEYLSAIEKEAAALKIFEMQEKIFQKGHLSTDSFKEAIRDRDASVAWTRIWRDRASALSFAAQQFRKRAAIAAGAPVDIDALYADFLGEWHADCSRIKGAVSLAEADYMLAEFRVQSGRKLGTSGAISQQELVEREAAFKAAEIRLKSRQDQDAVCLKDVPTIQYVRGILKP